MVANETRVQLDERSLHDPGLGGRVLAVVQTVIGMGRRPRGLAMQVHRRRRCVPLEFLEERDRIQGLGLEEGGAEGSPGKGFLSSLIERHVNKSGVISAKEECNKREIDSK